MPPVGSMCWMASMMVRRSPVGPVKAARCFANGATTTLSFGRRKAVSRVAASFTKSNRRDMLWLLSMSSANVAATRSWLTRFDGLPNAVFLHREVVRAEAGDESSLLVIHAGFEQHAGHIRDLGDLEGLEDHRVPAFPTLLVVDLYRKLPAFERILIGPLHGIRRPIIVGLEKRAIDVEADRAQRRPGWRLNLGHDAHRAHASRASEG